jgi:hypothetical protein
VKSAFYRRCQLCFVACDIDAFPAAEAGGRGDLMVVTMFLKGGSTRHDDDRSRVTKRGYERAHPRVRNDELCIPAQFVDTLRRQEFTPMETRGAVALVSESPYLAENVIAARFPAPIVHGNDEPIERELRTDRQQNHSTAPS